MPTIVDSLIVTLGLDPSEFSKGQTQAAAAFTKTGESAAKTGKAIEKSGKNAADAIGKIRDQALELFAIFAGGKGLKDFIGDLDTADQALGNMAQTLGLQPQTLGAFEGAAAAAGGSADAMGQTIAKLRMNFEELKVRGTSPIIPYLRAFTNATGVDLGSAGKTSLQFMNNLADAAHKLAQTDVQGATFLLNSIGITDPATVALMERGSKAFDQYYQTAQKYAATQKDVDAASGINKQLSFLEQALDKVGRAARDEFAPYIEGAAKAIRSFIDAHPEQAKIILEGLAGAITAAGVALTGAAIVAGIALIGTTAGTAVIAVAALVVAIKELEALQNGNWAKNEDAAHPWLGAIDNWAYTHSGGLLGLPSGPGVGANGGSAPSGSKGSGSGSDTSSAPPLTVHGNLPPIKGRVSPSQAAQILRSVGATPEEAAKLGALVNPESSGNPNAHNTNSRTGDNSYGLWQVNMIGSLMASRMKKYGLKSPNDLFDPYTNARIALDLYRNGGGARNWPNTYGGAMWRRDYGAASSGSADAATLPPTHPHIYSLPVPSDLFGAPGAATGHTINNQKTSSIDSDVNIGAIHVNVPSGDPNHIGSNISGIIRRNTLAMNGNYGIT